MKVGMVPLNFR